jgi:hypothetical protein
MRTMLTVLTKGARMAPPAHAGGEWADYLNSTCWLGGRLRLPFVGLARVRHFESFPGTFAKGWNHAGQDRYRPAWPPPDSQFRLPWF